MYDNFLGGETASIRGDGRQTGETGRSVRQEIFHYLLYGYMILFLAFTLLKQTTFEVPDSFECFKQPTCVKYALSSHSQKVMTKSNNAFQLVLNKLLILDQINIKCLLHDD